LEKRQKARIAATHAITFSFRSSSAPRIEGFADLFSASTIDNLFDTIAR
jgi:hypothetical protein